MKATFITTFEFDPLGDETNLVKLAIDGMHKSGEYREVSRTLKDNGTISVTFVCEEETN
ncbi:hypothetical protein [Bacillus mycoides]|uniref:hypothetical protein n=1 Tax=Bacillus mycoides TaxID=1405 RepID=UPI00027C178F|nr:hypothetical protein [Bacillus mycoides]EJV59328.1 hypothetical protein IEU_05593 [Bacillus mycoides]